jgi:hypothetical protein
VLRLKLAGSLGYVYGFKREWRTILKIFTFLGLVSILFFNTKECCPTLSKVGRITISIFFGGWNVRRVVLMARSRGRKNEGFT